MGYAILKGEGSIREKVRVLFTSRTYMNRRVVLGPLAALVPPDITKVSRFPAECASKPASGAEDSLAPLESRQRAAALESWYDFLAEEIEGPEGLLCFYDRPRARKVEYCSRFFVGLGMR